MYMTIYSLRFHYVFNVRFGEFGEPLPVSIENHQARLKFPCCAYFQAADCVYYNMRQIGSTVHY